MRTTMKTVTQLDDFTRAYLECALWAETDGDEPLDANYCVADFDADAIEKAVEDCQRFQAENAADLASYDHPQYTAAELGGHDFFLTRNRHGAGFWDRDALPSDAGERLTAAAHALGECNVTVGDDGLLYLN